MLHGTEAREPRAEEEGSLVGLPCIVSLMPSRPIAVATYGSEAASDGKIRPCSAADLAYPQIIRNYSSLLRKLVILLLL